MFSYRNGTTILSGRQSPYTYKNDIFSTERYQTINQVVNYNRNGKDANISVNNATRNHYNEKN